MLSRRFPTGTADNGETRRPITARTPLPRARPTRPRGTARMCPRCTTRSSIRQDSPTSIPTAAHRPRSQSGAEGDRPSLSKHCHEPRVAACRSRGWRRHCCLALPHEPHPAIDLPVVGRTAGRGHRVVLRLAVATRQRREQEIAFERITPSLLGFIVDARYPQGVNRCCEGEGGERTERRTGRNHRQPRRRGSHRVAGG